MNSDSVETQKSLEIRIRRLGISMVGRGTLDLAGKIYIALAVDRIDNGQT